MRYGIFSDIHSNLEALEVVIQAYKDEAIDAYLCVGDIIGYAANPEECIEKTKTLTNIVVAGNHDWAAVDLFPIDYFNPVARKALLWTKKNLNDSAKYFLESLKLVYKNEYLTLVHGTLDNPRDFEYMIDGYAAYTTFRILDTVVCFVGHSHAVGIFVKDQNGNLNYLEEPNIDIKKDNQYIINVGSVGQPRDKDPRAAYCIYDTDRKKVQIKRTDYDIKTARKKIIDAGLPGFLGDRLLLGK